jgi:spermidine synthase
MEKARPGQFDLLILDAYTSDSLPAHLVSIEAMRLYLEKLAPRGVIAVNISSRFFHLAPLFARMAQSLNMVCYINDDSNLAVPRSAGEYLSAWLAIARRREDLGRLLDNPQWEAVPVDPQTPMWTDDFSNVLSVFRWWP